MRLQVRDFGTALKFNGGTDTLITGANATLRVGSSDFSMGAWIKHSPTSSYDIDWLTLNGTSGLGCYIRAKSQTSVQVAFNDGSVNPFTNFSINYTNTWRFFVLTKIGTTATLYIDGVSAGTVSLGALGSITNTGTVFGISYRPNTGVSGTGNVDGAFVSSVGMTPTQVSNLYAKSLTPPSAIVDWRFDEGSGTTALDTSGNSNNGTITGATYTTDVLMKPRLAVRDFGTALSFNGASYVSLSNPSTYNVTNATFSIWYKPTTFAGLNSENWLFGKDEAGQRSFAIGPNNLGFMRIQNAGSPVSFGGIEAVLKLGVWQHIVVTYDSTNWKVYVNGTLAVTAAGVAIPVSTATLYIGQRGYAANQGFVTGSLDEPRIWNTALSASQISDLYFNNIVPSTGLIAEYKFNEGSGTVATDTSSTANNGTITGATYTSDVVMKNRTAISSARTAAGTRTAA